MIAIAPLLAGLIASPQLILHLRADTGVVLDANSRVRVWKDLSPRHTDFVTTNFGTPRAVFVTRYHDTAEKRIYKTYAADSILRPRVSQHGIGDRPSVVFDGQQALVDTTSLPLDSGFTLFAIAQDSTGNGYAATLIDKGPGDMNTAFSNGWADSINGCLALGIPWIDNITTSNFQSSNPTLYGSSWDGRSGSLMANGQTLSTGTSARSITRNKTTWIGGVKNPHGDLQSFLTGRISEIRVYSGALDSADRKAIEDSLLGRYSIRTTPPAKPDRKILHLRADTGVVLDANNRVALWKDLSSRHTDFGTSTLGRPQAVLTTNNYDTSEKRVYKTFDNDSVLRPRVVLDGIGGRPAIQFEGSQLLTNASSLPLDSGYTLFAVVQDSNIVGQPAVVLTKGPNDFNNTLSNGWNNDLCGNWSVSVAWKQCLEFSNLHTNAPALYVNAFDGLKGTSFINGAFQAQGNLSTSVQRNKDTWIGATINPHGMLQSFLKGRISEIVVYAGALDSAERKAIEDSLLRRYSIRTTPPAKPDRRILHLRADTGVVLDANNRVALWKDLSQRHTDFGTSTLGRPQAVFTTNNYDTAEKRVYKTFDNDSVLRPRVVLDGIGGRPAVMFDGAQLLTNASSLPLDSGYTLFAIAQDSNVVGQPAALFTKGPSDFNNTLSNGWNDNLCGNWSVSVAWNQCLEYSNVHTFAPALYENVFDGKNGTSYINGAFQATGTLNTFFQRNKDAWMGATINPHGMLQSFLKGRISEIVVYAGALDSAERKAIESALMAAYAVKIDSSAAQTGVARQAFAGTKIFRAGSGYRILTTEFDQLMMVTPSGKILSRSEIVGGQAVLPEFHGTAILRLAGPGRTSLTRMLTSQR